MSSYIEILAYISYMFHAFILDTFVNVPENLNSQFEILAEFTLS